MMAILNIARPDVHQKYAEKKNVEYTSFSEWSSCYCCLLLNSLAVLNMRIRDHLQNRLTRWRLSLCQRSELYLCVGRATARAAESPSSARVQQTRTTWMFTREFSHGLLPLLEGSGSFNCCLLVFSETNWVSACQQAKSKHETKLQGLK